jgi:hypothetical protein
MLPLTARAAGGKPKTLAGRRGRKPGSGRINDDQLLVEMLHLLVTGVPSVWAATEQFADGNDSTRRRLLRKFIDKWGTEPLPGKTWKDVEDELKAN